MVEAAKVALVVYGVLLAAGGIAGFKMAGSAASVVMGVAAGLLSVAAAVWAGRSPVAGLNAGFAVALVVAAAMLVRYLGSRKLMPAGLTAILSVIMIVVLSMALQSARGRS